jgi:uncharacterized protein
MNKKQFRDKYGPWAVVTGASSGIGREIALRLSEAGLNLVLVARNDLVLKQLADDLRERNGIETIVAAIDLAVETGVETLSATTRDLDVGLLVASAGFGTSGSFLDAKLEDEIDMLNVNCRALMGLTLYFGQRFAKRKRAGIVLLSSMVGFQGAAFAAHYAATKAYVLVLAESLHVELSAVGIDVIASAPGPTRSGFDDRAGFQMSMSMKADRVALDTLSRLGSKSTVLPGLLTKLLVYAKAPLPRWIRVRIMSSVMKSATKHQRANRSSE